MKLVIFFLALIQTFYGEPMKTEPTPQYLYKILSVEDWNASQNKKFLKLPVSDSEFIHFSKDDQLERIIGKYWNGVPEFVILTIDPSKLPGKLVFETNPGGSAKYYHLYDGAIPPNAIVEVNIRSCKK